MMAGLPEQAALGSLVLHNISGPFCIQPVLLVVTTSSHYDYDLPERCLQVCQEILKGSGEFFAG